MVVALVVLVLAGCGSDSADQSQAGASLTESQLRNALDQLPLSIDYHDEQYSGNGTAVGGTATDGRASVKFEIVSGHPDIKNPVFPQRDLGIHVQRGVGNGYTLTFNVPPTLAADKQQAAISVPIELAVCRLAKNCGGPTG